MNAHYKKWVVTALSLVASLLLVACQPQAPNTAADQSAVQEEAAPNDTMASPSDSAQAPATEAVAGAGETAAATAPAAPAAPASTARPAPKPAAEPYAQVISVTPVRRSVDNPQQVCHDVEVVYHVAPKDENKIAGTVIGAVAGAVVGSQIGKGHGRDAARVAGAVGGAVAGRKIQESQQEKKTQTRIERQCETVNDPTFEVIGYDIIYSYDGQSHAARVAEDPGPRIKLPVRSIDP